MVPLGPFGKLAARLPAAESRRRTENSSPIAAVLDDEQTLLATGVLGSAQLEIVVAE